MMNWQSIACEDTWPTEVSQSRITKPKHEATAFPLRLRYRDLNGDVVTYLSLLKNNKIPYLV